MTEGLAGLFHHELDMWCCGAMDLDESLVSFFFLQMYKRTVVDNFVCFASANN